MKVLYLTSSLGVGGIETNLVRLTKELTGRGHEVAVAAKPGVLVEPLEAAGGTFVPVTASHRRPLAAARSVLELRRAVSALRPDVIHVFAASSAAVLWPALRSMRRRPPVVSTIMGLKMAADEPEWVSHLRAWGVTLGADRLVVTAPAIGATVARLPVRPRRVVEGQVVGIPVVPVDGPVTDLRRELGLAATTRLVVTVGRLAADKSHHLFLEAAAAAWRRRDDVHFVVVGGGPLRDELEACHRRLGLEGRATLLGERHDVDGILRAADVCVKPGVVEGFVGMTVLEAQMLGVPVVAFDTEDVRLAIEDGRSGLIVPAGDVAALTEAVLSLLDDGGRARALAAEGRVRTVERFSLPKVVDGLLALYADVLRWG